MNSEPSPSLASTAPRGCGALAPPELGTEAAEPLSHRYQFARAATSVLELSYRTTGQQEAMMKIDGQCHCGSVRYEANIEPDEVSICHCTDCQMLTGSAYRVTVMAARDGIRLTGNEPKTYIKTAESGQKRIQQFCAECGSPMFTTGLREDAEVWGIRWGTIRQRRELAPRRQIWCRSALPWIHDLRDLPGSERD